MRRKEGGLRTAFSVLVSIEFAKVGDDGSGFLLGRIHARHQHIARIQWLHLAFTIDRLRIENELGKQSFVVFTNHVHQVWPGAAEMTSGTAEPREIALSLFRE